MRLGRYENGWLAVNQALCNEARDGAEEALVTTVELHGVVPGQRGFLIAVLQGSIHPGRIAPSPTPRTPECSGRA